MIWHQLKTPNLGITYTGGMCLKAVRDAFGVQAKYGWAIDDWNSGSQHFDPIPEGISVPVYFSLGKVPAGHVAIRLPDGKVASSTQGGTHKGLYIHPDMTDLIRIYSDPKYGNGVCKYLGWSEEVNDIKVIGGSMFDDLAVRRAVEGAYGEFLPQQHPSQETIDNHVKAIQLAQGFGQFYKDIHAAMIGSNSEIVEKARKYDGAKKDYFS